MRETDAGAGHEIWKQGRQVDHPKGLPVAGAERPRRTEIPRIDPPRALVGRDDHVPHRRQEDDRGPEPEARAEEHDQKRDERRSRRDDHHADPRLEGAVGPGLPPHEDAQWHADGKAGAVPDQHLQQRHSQGGEREAIAQDGEELAGHVREGGEPGGPGGPAGHLPHHQRDGDPGERYEPTSGPGRGRLSHSRPPDATAPPMSPAGGAVPAPPGRPGRAWPARPRARRCRRHWPPFSWRRPGSRPRRTARP